VVGVWGDTGFCVSAATPPIDVLVVMGCVGTILEGATVSCGHNVKKRTHMKPKPTRPMRAAATIVCFFIFVSIVYKTLGVSAIFIKIARRKYLYIN
jgi:hypothetical protein